MASSDSGLTAFERAFLERLLTAVPGLYLSGGGALALHLGHRRSLDLDLFTTDAATFQAALVSVPVVAASMGAGVEILTTGPAFRRVLLTGSDGAALRVDLVLDSAERVGPPPVDIQRVRVDPLEEILANKICAVLGRSEPRDLVDLFFLEKAGHRVVDALPAAQRKDGGLTPAQLAWSIALVNLDQAPEGLLASVSVEELRAFRTRLVEALERLSFPGPRPHSGTNAKARAGAASLSPRLVRWTPPA